MHQNITLHRVSDEIEYVTPNTIVRVFKFLPKIIEPIYPPPLDMTQQQCKNNEKMTIKNLKNPIFLVN